MRKPKEIKKCIRCGLVFGEAYHCPKCHTELAEPYLAIPTKQTKGGSYCQFCVEELGLERSSYKPQGVNVANSEPFETIVKIMSECSNRLFGKDKCDSRCSCFNTCVRDFDVHIANDDKYLKKNSDREIEHFEVLRSVRRMVAG